MLSRLRCDGILIRCKLYSKRQPEVPVTPSGGKELHCTLWRRLFDACLVALKSISPGQRIYYGTLRCHALPSKENFPRQRLPPCFFCNRYFSRPYSAALFFPPRGVTGTSGYCFEYNSKFHHTSIVKASVRGFTVYYCCDRRP